MATAGSTDKPIILVIGCTGKTGKLVAAYLEEHSNALTVRFCSRRQDQVDAWLKEGRNAVLLDLDDPSTFALALFGVARLFLCTGYSVAMCTQSKTIVDAARRANVQHIVHLGLFTDRQSTDPHIVWHDLVEAYIERSGIAWTHLHPNMFTENLFSPNICNPHGKQVLDFFRGQRAGWVACSDIAKVTAVALREGPAKHGAKDYWLITDVVTMPEIAAIISEVLGKNISTADKSSLEDFDKYFTSSPIWKETWYLESARIFQQQIINGELGYLGTVRDDGRFLTGTPSLKLKEWIQQHKEDFLKIF